MPEVPVKVFVRVRIVILTIPVLREKKIHFPYNYLFVLGLIIGEALVGGGAA